MKDVLRKINPNASKLHFDFSPFVPGIYTAPVSHSMPYREGRLVARLLADRPVLPLLTPLRASRLSESDIRKWESGH